MNIMLLDEHNILRILSPLQNSLDKAWQMHNQFFTCTHPKFKYAVALDFAVDKINPSQFVVFTIEGKLLYCQFKKPKNVCIEIPLETSLKEQFLNNLSNLDFRETLSNNGLKVVSGPDAYFTMFFNNGFVGIESLNINTQKRELHYFSVHRHIVEKLSRNSHWDKTAEQIKELGVEPDNEIEELVIDPLERCVQLREVYK